MQAGKDVYVEKPVSHNVSEGRRIVEAARKFNRICQTGTQSRSQPGMRAAIEAVQGGKIGKVGLAYGTCYKPRGSIGLTKGPQPTPPKCDYDLWCGPAPKTPLRRKKLHYDWHWDYMTGNGDLGNQGIHEMDKARWGLNQNGLPTKIVSAGGRFGYIDDANTANTQVCYFQFDGGAELIFEVRGLPTKDYRGSKVGNVFVGPEGIIVCPSYSLGIHYSPDGKEVTRFDGKGQEGGDGNHFDNFLKAVRSRKVSDLNADILEGHLSSAMCHLGNLSYRNGEEKPMTDAPNCTDDKDAKDSLTRMLAHLEDNKIDPAKAVGRVGIPLVFDPASERFGGELSRLNSQLSREYRKGFEVPEKI